jgi:hypothetical protein
VLPLFRDNDILLTLATPYPAPFIGQKMIENDGAIVPACPYQVPASGTAWRGSLTSTKPVISVVRSLSGRPKIEARHGPMTRVPPLF